MENLIYIIFYIFLPMIAISAIISFSEQLLKKTKNINLSTQIISSPILKKQNSIFSKINNINEWMQFYLMVSASFLLIIMFPMSEFYKLNENSINILNSFHIDNFIKLMFGFIVFDLYFLNINSKESSKIKNYTLISILEFIIVLFLFQNEHIERTWEILKIQNSLINVWIYKHAIIIFILFCFKIYKLLMLLEAYTNTYARNFRLINEAFIICIFSFGNFITVKIDYLEILTLAQFILFCFRIMTVYLFLKMFFNQIPRRYHVEV